MPAAGSKRRPNRREPGSSAQKQNAEAAALKRLDLLLDTQRRQVAHSAGEHWSPLLEYLSGNLKRLPEG